MTAIVFTDRTIALVIHSLDPSLFGLLIPIQFRPPPVAYVVQTVYLALPSSPPDDQPDKKDNHRDEKNRCNLHEGSFAARQEAQGSLT